MGAFRRGREGLLDARMRSTLSSSGAVKPLPNGRALGAMVRHPPSARGMLPCPDQGR